MSEAMIHVGAKVEKDSAENIANAITEMFESARKNGISESVQIEALNVMRNAFDVSDVTIQSCNMENDNSKSVEINVPSDFDIK